MRKSRVVIGILLCLLFLMSGGIGYIFFTVKGVETVVKSVLAKHVKEGDVIFSVSEGSLVEGVTFEDVELKDLKDFPEGTVLKVQRFFVRLVSFGVDGLQAEIENARLLLPGADPILLTGTFKGGVVDFNLFSKGFTIETVLEYAPQFQKMLSGMTGSVDDIDLYLKGEYTAPHITGDVVLDRVLYKGILLKETPLTLDLTPKDWNNTFRLNGTIFIHGGMLQSKNTFVQLEESRIYFSGPPENPSFHVQGKSNIEKVRIKIGLKGTLESPDLTLSSEPSLTKETLMVMLATGKRWKGLEQTLDQNALSSNLTKDFVDYFLFAGRGNKFAQKFGLTNFSVDYSEDSRGVSATKSLSEKLDIGYGVEQTVGDGTDSQVKHTIESRYQINDRLSVGVEREIQQKQTDDSTSEAINANNDKVLFKYKKSF